MRATVSRDVQRRYWSDCDEVRFRWQTDNGVQARREEELARRVEMHAGDLLLEIGCGEGANLHHLRTAGGVRFGIDFSAAKAAFAHRATASHTAAADAENLPFAAHSFDVVLIRDVLHHVPNPAAVLAEAFRVLRPGGRLTLIEPNSRSPLVLAQAALIPAERGVFSSTSEHLAARLREAGFAVVSSTTAHPFPIERILLHPAIGLPSLARVPWVAPGLRALDRVAQRLLPKGLWMYLILEAIRPEAK